MYLRPRNTTKFAHSRPVIECAQCGKQLFVPERSEFIDDRRVREDFFAGCVRRELNLDARDASPPGVIFFVECAQIANT